MATRMATTDRAEAGAMARSKNGWTIYQVCDSDAGCPPLEPGPPHAETGKPTKVRPKHRCKGRWRGSFENGWTERGTRRRVTASGATQAEVRNKLAAKQRAIEEAGASAARAG